MLIQNVNSTWWAENERVESHGTFLSARMISAGKPCLSYRERHSSPSGPADFIQRKNHSQPQSW